MTKEMIVEEPTKKRVRMQCFPCRKTIVVDVVARTDRNAVHKAWEEHEKDCVANAEEINDHA